MKRLPILLVAVVLLAMLAATMFSFTVKFNEVAVKTQFGEVQSVVTEPGLYFRWPLPIQDVQTYPNTLQIVEKPATEVQTSDRYSIVARMYLTWKVTDPLKFSTSTKYLAAADDKLLAAMSEAQAVISSYAFADLFNTNGDSVQLGTIEAEILARVQQSVAQQDLGLEVTSFGLPRLLFPESITPKVAERMIASREAFAANTREQGETQARDIRSKAEQIASRIENFASTEAQRIRTEGEEIANRQFPTFAANPDLAIFLLNVDALKQILSAGQSTFFLDANRLDPFHLFTPEGLENGAAQPADSDS